MRFTKESPSQSLTKEINLSETVCSMLAFFFLSLRRIIQMAGFLFFLRVLEKTAGSHLCSPQVLCSEQPCIPGLDCRTQDGKGGWEEISTPQVSMGSGWRNPPWTSPETASCLAPFPFLFCFLHILTLLPCELCSNKSFAHEDCLRVCFWDAWPKTWTSRAQTPHWKF